VTLPRLNLTRMLSFAVAANTGLTPGLNPEEVHNENATTEEVRVVSRQQHRFEARRTTKRTERVTRRAK
jgi:hypothetical protein